MSPPHSTFPLHSAPNLDIPDADPSPETSSRPWFPYPPTGTRQGKGCEAGGRVYSTKCAPSPRPRPPPTGAPTPQGQGPHLLVGFGESQPHALVGGAAVPGWASLAAEARAGVDAAYAGKAGMGVTLGEEGPQRIRRCELGSPRAEPYGSFILESPRAIIQHLRGCHGAEAIVPGVRCDFVLIGAEVRPGGERGASGGGFSWDLVGWVVMGGGRNCEGGNPQRRVEVVFGA